MELIKFYIGHSNCTKVRLKFEDEVIVLTQGHPHLVPNIPKNRKKIMAFAKTRFVASTKNIDSKEVVEYIMNPKNFADIQNVLKPGTDAVTMNKFKPENEADIVAKLKKNGYKVIAPEDGASMIYSIKEAKSFLESKGYEVNKVKEVTMTTEKYGENELRDIRSTEMDYNGKTVQELKAICKHRDIALPQAAKKITILDLIMRADEKRMKNKEEEQLDEVIDSLEKKKDITEGLSWKEIKDLAKEKGIKTFGVKKEDLIKELNK